MPTLLKNTPLYVGGNKIYANSISFESSALISPVYRDGDRHSFNYVPVGANVNSLTFSYFLTGNDPIKSYLSKDDLFLSGRVSNFAFNSGCLTNYSCKFSPNGALEANVTMSVFDYFTGSFVPEVSNTKIIPLNASSLSVQNLSSGTISLGNFESASYDYSAEITPVYHVETGLNVQNISPSRVAWGKKQVRMSFSSDSLNPYLTVNGKDASVRIEARDYQSNSLEVFSVSGKIIKLSSSIQSDAPSVQAYELIQNRIESSPVISSFSPSSATQGQYITVVGSNFNNITDIYLGQDKINSFLRIDDSNVSFQIPASANSGVIRFNSFEETAFSPSGLFLTYSPIVISSFSPTNVVSGESTIIYGSNFYKISEVLFNGTQATFTTLSDSSIQAITPGRILNGPISVVSSSRYISGESASGSDYFSNPVVDGFSPSTGVPGNTISISGANFKNLNSVLVNGISAAYSIVNTGNLTFTVPTGNVWGKIKVLNTAGQFAETPYSFTPYITVTGNWPRSGIAYSSHSISGINFQTGLLYEILPNQYKVSFNGIITGFYLQNQDRLTGRVPIGAESGPIYIFKSDGTAMYSSTGSFIYIDDAPVVSKAFPSGLISGDSININILGDNIKNLTKVYLTGDPSGLASGKSITVWDRNYNINAIPVDTLTLRTLNTTLSPDYFGVAANVANNFGVPYSLSGNGFITGLAVTTGKWFLGTNNDGGTGNLFGPISISELPKISHYDTTTLSLSSPSYSPDPLRYAPIFALDGNTGTYSETNAGGITGTYTFNFSNVCQIHRIKVTTHSQTYVDDGANPRYLQFILGTGTNTPVYSGNAQIAPYSTYTSGYTINTGTLSWRHEAKYVQIKSHYLIAGTEQLMPLKLAEVEIYGIPTYR